MTKLHCLFFYFYCQCWVLTSPFKNHVVSAFPYKPNSKEEDKTPRRISRTETISFFPIRFQPLMEVPGPKKGVCP